ncbi:MAG: GreA/GreB family elongation factor [Bacillota bacterium]
MDEERKEKPRPFSADPGRLRRETRAEAPIGKAIEQAAAEAENRVMRQRGYPPPTEAERELIAASPRAPVQLFTTVLLTDLEGGEPERYQLVPDEAADPAAGRISLGSPLGRALFQEYPGAVVAVRAPAGTRLCRILQVHP